MTLRYGDRHQLTEEDALVYAKLRELRKEIATSEEIPLYDVFNNKELVEMIRKKARTKQHLEGIVGVGSPRVEKYGERFLEFMAKQQGTADEMGEPTV